MLKRLGGAAIALGLSVFAISALGQERANPAIEHQPVTEAGQEAGTKQSQGQTENEDAAANEIGATLKTIESAIRDLEATPDAEQRQRDEQREVADLQAQQEMALWAERMTWATWASVGLTLVGIFLIWRTLSHTAAAAQYTKVAAEAALETVREAKKTTAASVAAAEAAVAANDLTHTAIVVQHRAWLSVTDVKATSALRWQGPIGRLSVGFDIKNVGQTPAHKIFSEVEIKLVPLVQQLDAYNQLASLCRIHAEKVGQQAFDVPFSLPPDASMNMGHGEVPVDGAPQWSGEDGKAVGINIHTRCYMIVCVCYTLAVGGEAKVAGGIFDIFRCPGSEILPINPQLGDVPAKHLRLVGRGPMAD